MQMWPGLYSGVTWGVGAGITRFYF